MKMETEMKYEVPEVLVLLTKVEVGFAGSIDEGDGGTGGASPKETSPW